MPAPSVSVAVMRRSGLRGAWQLRWIGQEPLWISVVSKRESERDGEALFRSYRFVAQGLAQKGGDGAQPRIAARRLCRRMIRPIGEEREEDSENAVFSGRIFTR